MKYIKKFEELNADSIDKYKKYVLYKANSNTYFILEPVAYLPTYIEANKKYTYLLNKNKLKHNRYQYYNFNYDKGDKNIVYQSDDLNEVKDMALALSDISKYNI